MPAETLPLTPEFQDITFSLQCSLSSHNPHFPDNLLSTPMINKKTSLTLSLPIWFSDTVCTQGNLIFVSSIDAVTGMGRGAAVPLHPCLCPLPAEERDLLKSYWFRREPFTIAKLQSPNCNHHRCFFAFSRRHLLPCWSSWDFVKKMCFPPLENCWHSDELLLLLNLSLWPAREPGE